MREKKPFTFLLSLFQIKSKADPKDETELTSRLRWRYPAGGRGHGTWRASASSPFPHYCLGVSGHCHTCIRTHQKNRESPCLSFCLVSTLDTDRIHLHCIPSGQVPGASGMCLTSIADHSSSALSLRGGSQFVCPSPAPLPYSGVWTRMDGGSQRRKVKSGGLRLERGKA